MNAILRTSFAWCGLTLALGGAASFFACSANGDLGARPGTGGAGGEGGARASTSTASSASGLGGAFGAGGGGGGSANCSADLHDVLSDGKVVQTCAPDQGCQDGVCVPACQAAGASKGNVGCDFRIPTPSFHSTSTPPCFAVFVTNPWGTPVQIKASYGASMLDVTTFARVPQAGMPESQWPLLTPAGLPSGEVAVLFVSGDPKSNNFGKPLACPVAEALSMGTAIAGTGKGTSFHVTTSAPTTLYDILPYGGGKSFLPSAELVMPTSAWGTNYVAILPPSQNELWAQVTAAQDGTTVTIFPSVDLPSGPGVAAAPKGIAAQFHLDAGEVLQWEAAPQTTLDLSGSIVQSDKPVSMAGGSGYFCHGGGCDSAHQALQAVQALGSEYVASSAPRCPGTIKELFYYRAVGLVDGTNLTFDPPLTSAPATLDKGQIADFEDNTIKQPYAKAATAFRVTSQDDAHPFYLEQIMGGELMLSPDPTCPGIGPNPPPGEWTLGDEEFVNVLAPKQFLPRYVFFTDPTYATTSLVLVRQKTAKGFEDVTVDCLGVVSGWTPVGASGRFETARVDLVRVKGIGSCQNGAHEAHSAAPFGMTVWGFDVFASYAYPAGGNAAAINSVVVPPK